MVFSCASNSQLSHLITGRAVKPWPEIKVSLLLSQQTSTQCRYVCMNSDINFNDISFTSRHAQTRSVPSSSTNECKLFNIHVILLYIHIQLCVYIWHVGMGLKFNDYIIIHTMSVSYLHVPKLIFMSYTYTIVCVWHVGMGLHNNTYIYYYIIMHIKDSIGLH